MSDTPTPHVPKWTGWALALVTIGALILVPSGLCTGAFGIGAIYEAATGSVSDATDLLTMALVVGGPFIAVGIALILSGRSISRRG
jgi:hypothetical protein